MLPDMYQGSSNFSHHNMVLKRAWRLDVARCVPRFLYLKPLVAHCSEEGMGTGCCQTCTEVPLLVAISIVHGSEECMGAGCCKTCTVVPLLVAISSTWFSRGHGGWMLPDVYRGSSTCSHQ
jgi:hypothetical protein